MRKPGVSTFFRHVLKIVYVKKKKLKVNIASLTPPRGYFKP